MALIILRTVDLAAAALDGLFEHPFIFFRMITDCGTSWMSLLSGARSRVVSFTVPVKGLLAVESALHLFMFAGRMQPRCSHGGRGIAAANDQSRLSGLKGAIE